MPTGVIYYDRFNPRFKANQPCPPKQSQVTSPSDQKDEPKYNDRLLDFMDQATSVYHSVDYFSRRLNHKGFQRLRLEDAALWKLARGGKYYVVRNGSNIMAFVVGQQFKAGNGAAIVACHCDQVGFKLKPVSKDITGGFDRILIAPYGGLLLRRWFDRDLGLSGQVFIKKGNCVEARLFRSSHAIGTLPSIAVHFGKEASTYCDEDLNAAPITGIAAEKNVSSSSDSYLANKHITGRHAKELLDYIASELGVATEAIVDFDLILYAVEKAKIIGIKQDMIASSRFDDKIGSFESMEALITSSTSMENYPGIMCCVSYDNEEIGSGTYVGAKSNLLTKVLSEVDRKINAVNVQSDTMTMTLENSFLVSNDVSHALNPNYMKFYDPIMSPRFNQGPTLWIDPMNRSATNVEGRTFIQALAALDPDSPPLQMTQSSNETSNQGSTLGPFIATSLGIRSVEVGTSIMAMHSARELVGVNDSSTTSKFLSTFFSLYFEAKKKFLTIH